MIRSFVFTQNRLLQQDAALDFLRVVLADEGVHVWVDIGETPDAEVKAVLEGVFNFHPLAIEDCLTPSDLPKVDEYEGYVFMVIHGVAYSADAHEFRTTELNLFIGKNFLVTVHRDRMRSVDAAVDRALKNASAVARAPDRLTYTLLDFLLENYEPALEGLSGEVAQIEQGALENPMGQTVGSLMKLKTEVQRLRRIVWPQREVISRLAHGQFKVVRAHMLPYYRDLLDHLVRISDQTENYRESLNGVLHIQLNMQQKQVNEHIRFLTVLATLAMPLFIITSFYGMNFPFPEYKWRTGHLWVLAVTGGLTLLLYRFLRRRGA